MRALIIIIFSCIQITSISQDLRLTDSLFKIINDPSLVCKGKCLKDTIIINAYNSLGNHWGSVSPDSSIYFFKIAISHEKELLRRENIPEPIRIFATLKLASSTTGIAWGNYFLGNYDEAIKFSKKALEISAKYEKRPELKIKMARLKSYIYNNLSSVYNDKGDHENAIKYYYKNLRTAELSGSKGLMSAATGNLGLYYYRLGELEKALEYSLQSAKLNKEEGNLAGEASSFGNLSMIYSSMGDKVKAKDYSLKSIAMHEKTGNIYGQAVELANLAYLYMDDEDFQNAVICFEKSLALHTQMENKTGMASTMGSMGSMYIRLGNYDKAEKYLTDYLKLAKEIQSKYELEYAYQCLTDLYEFTNRPALAIQSYKMYILYRDSLKNEENTKIQLQSEIQFRFDKKAAEDSVKHADEQKIQAAEIAKQDAEIAKQDAEIKNKNLQQILLFAGLGLVVVFSIFMYNRFRVIRKQKEELAASKKIIEEQKHIVEEKHKEITDSINYAERIQRSFLATKEMLDENLGEYMVIFKPKDVVSGDFYWSHKAADGNFLLACADSTGHGVPGAIMSLLNISSLEKSVEKHADPAEILNETRRIIIERLKKDGSPEGGKDGMDCALVSFDFKKQKINFALSNNPLWLIRNNQLTEFKPDKMPVGKHDKQHEPFTSHSFDIQKGDLIFILTDGYADQFGGEKGKKFKYSALQQLILKNTSSSFVHLYDELVNAFENWKGNLEQVDDVCIIGVRM